MGGDGSGRKIGTDKLIANLQGNMPKTEGEGTIYLPDYSGVQTAALKASPPLGSGSGTTNHALLTNLDYASAAHTGFQPAGSYLTAETDPQFMLLSGAITSYPLIGSFNSLSGAYALTSGNYIAHAADSTDPHGATLTQTNLSVLTSGTIAGMNITNDGTKTTFLGTAGDYVRIGDAGVTGNGELATNDDLLITGKLEVNGETHLNGTTRFWSDSNFFTAFNIFNGAFFNFLDDTYTGKGIFKAMSDFDQFLIGIGDSYGRQLVLFDYSSDLSYRDFDHATQTNPTLYIQSATDPDTNNTQWLSLTHDQTNGIINVGTGNVVITRPQASGAFYAADGTIGYTGTIGTLSGAVVKNGIVTGYV